MPALPTANKIHSLPVLVSYKLPSCKTSYTTLLANTAQVYVHAKAAVPGQSASSSHGEGEDDVWGSIYLKTVVQGVLMASPELFPYSPGPDLSLYVLDPRETASRRLRSSRMTATQSPSSPATANPFLLHQSSEVWSGKGLLSWALAEPGQGKNLITGRLIKSVDFASVVKGGIAINPLEALVMAEEGEGWWGVEVCVSVRDNSRPMGMGVQAAIPVAGQNPMNGGVRDMGHARRQSTNSNASLPAVHDQPTVGLQSTTVPTRSDIRAMPKSTSQPRLSAIAQPHTSPIRPSENHLAGRKRKAMHAHSQSADLSERALGDISACLNGSHIPAALYEDPASLTQEQAKRLLESPSFLELLERTANKPALGVRKGPVKIQAAPVNPSDPPTSSAVVNKPNKKARGEPTGGRPRAHKSEMKCWNCGRTKSSVWRSRTMEDGNVVRVCNACGLYWNNQKKWRPPSLWTAEVDEEPAERPQRNRKVKQPSSSTGAPSSSTMVPSSTPNHDKGKTNANLQQVRASSGTPSFKRTLSAVVNEDAKRIQAMKDRTVAGQARKSGLGQVQGHDHGSTGDQARFSVKPAMVNGVATSASALASADKRASGTTRQISNVSRSASDTASEAASATVVLQNMTQMPMSDPGFDFSTIFNSSSIPLGKLSGQDNHSQPMSDLGAGFSGNDNTCWDTDLSTLFDVDAYTADQGGMNGTSKAKEAPPTPVRRSPRKHAPAPQSKQISRHASSDSAETRSNLFTTNSSAPNSPSPSRPRTLPSSQQVTANKMGDAPRQGQSTFDFSALPPSSPPIGLFSESEEHSALLMSSPDEGIQQGGPGQEVGRVSGPNQGVVQDGTPLTLDPPSVCRTDSSIGYSTGFDLTQNHAVMPIPNPYGTYGMGVGVGIGMDQSVTTVMNTTHGLTTGTDVFEGMSMEDLARMINESGIDQAGWDELFGMVNQQVDAGSTSGMMMGGQQQQLQLQQLQQHSRQIGMATVDGQEVLGQFGGVGEDWFVDIA